MKLIIKTFILAFGVMSVSSTLHAQRLKVKGNIGLASDYVWRGMYQNSGCSLQPEMTLNFGRLSVDIWGSQSITNTTDAPQEFDISAIYSHKGLTITITDYWWDGINAPYGYYKDKHHFEVGLKYSCNQKTPLSISWSAIFAGTDNNKDNNRAYSSYINISYDASLSKDITLTPSMGFTPWKGMYNDKGGTLTDLCLKICKTISLSSNVKLPIYVLAIVSPSQDKTYLIGGLNVCF